MSTKVGLGDKTGVGAGAGHAEKKGLGLGAGADVPAKLSSVPAAQAGKSSPYHHSEQVLKGDAAVKATAALLHHRIDNDELLTQYVNKKNSKVLTAELEQFLAFTFESAEWPTVTVCDDLVDGVFSGFAEALIEATVLCDPPATGHDLLLDALARLGREMHGDERIVGFHSHLRKAAKEHDHTTHHKTHVGGAQLLPSDGDAAAQGGIVVDSFTELLLEESQLQAARDAWNFFLSAASSKEAAGEAIYNALFEGAPSLQSLFTTPRAVQAMRFMNGLSGFVMALDDPPKLKSLVETLGFGHLQLDVTPPRIVLFRDAIIDLFSVELGRRFEPAMHESWRRILNYIGGAIVYIKAHYAQRIAILADSWEKANTADHAKKGETEKKDKSAVAKLKKAETADQDALESHRMTQKIDKGEASEGKDQANPDEGEDPDVLSKEEQPEHGDRFSALRRHRDKLVRNLRPSALADGAKRRIRPRTAALRRMLRPQKTTASDEAGRLGTTGFQAENTNRDDKAQAQNVPTTFKEMFMFNSAVMGFGNSTWMMEVLELFDNIVANVSNSTRLQEECDMLALRISKRTKAGVNLSEYKACMLASLRNLLPKDWSTDHEVAWTWLWENVERLLGKIMGNPPVYERALSRTMAKMSEDEKYEMRKQIYAVFFVAAPLGQDFFKQSNTRLHFIAERIMEMTSEIFRQPVQMVDTISALGLRHVGYAIPVELTGPFVSACIEVLMQFTKDETAIEAFRWSLALIQKMLVRTITEGSTIVMKAINVNSTKMLRKAIGCAPRGKRAIWLLHVQVGTQSISPLYWAITSGNLAVADAMLKDLVTIRADREEYYYGVDELFFRHPDVIKLFTVDAPTLLPSFLDGLIWRSRVTVDGQRRVNYYVKHLVADAEGSVSKALKYMVQLKNPKILSHPTVVTVSEILWGGVVKKEFILGKLFFILSVVVFTASQAVLPKVNATEEEKSIIHIAILIGRIMNYVLSMGRLTVIHATSFARAFREKDTSTVLLLPVPRYLFDMDNLAGFVLTVLLAAMCTHEPMLHCVAHEDWPTDQCEESTQFIIRYAIFSMCAMVFHWLLLIDLSVFSTNLSAFVLVIVHVGSEIVRFVVALCFLLCIFGSAISVLPTDQMEYRDVSNAFLSLLAITLTMYEKDYGEMTHEPALLFSVFLFKAVSAILLLNLLIAQLNCSYEFIYQDMLGFARLNRAQVIVETLEACPKARWAKFLHTLKFDVPLEFNEGDVGMAGGIQMLEDQSMHPVVIDCIMRYGGSCSPEMQWPEDQAEDEEDDTFERMEDMIKKALKKAAKIERGGEGSGSGSTAEDDDD